MASFTLTGTSLKGLFTRSPCTMYPVRPQVHTEATKGHVEVDIATCILCGICAKKCPTDAITVAKAAGAWTIDPFRCIQCGNCVRSCPKDSLRMVADYTAPSAIKTTRTVQRPSEDPQGQSSEKGVEDASVANATTEASVPAAHGVGEEGNVTETEGSTE